MFEPFANPDASLLIRTDFTDDAAWKRLSDLVQKPDPDEGFCAGFVCVDDPEIGAMPIEALAQHVRTELGRRAVFIADSTAMSAPDFAIVCVDTHSASLPMFRVTPAEIWGPENSLRLGNIDFAEFAAAVDSDGVFRGF